MICGPAEGLQCSREPTGMTFGSTEKPEKNPKSQLKQPAGQLKN